MLFKFIYVASLNSRILELISTTQFYCLNDFVSHSFKSNFAFQNWFAKTFEKFLVHILTKCSGNYFAEYIALYMIVVDHNFQKNPSFFPPWP